MVYVMEAVEAAADSADSAVIALMVAAAAAATMVEVAAVAVVAVVADDKMLDGDDSHAVYLYPYYPCDHVVNVMGKQTTK